MTTLTYAGIGARATPAAVLADMTVMSAWLARTGWHLASGGADGADSAFATGTPTGQRTIWLPWRGYNGALRAGLPGAVSVGVIGVHGGCGNPASRVGSVFAYRPEAPCQERVDPAFGDPRTPG